MKTKHYSQVKLYKGKPAFIIDSKPQSPYIYALTDRFKGSMTWDDVPSQSIKTFADIGCSIFQVDVHSERIIKNNKVDIDFIKKQVRGITKYCDNASIMLRLHVNPTIEWINAHPSEIVKYADVETIKNENLSGQRSFTDYDLKPLERASYASEIWLDEYSDHVREIINQIENCEEGNNIFAIQIANGIYGENHYWGGIRYLPDVSECMQIKFRKYLKEKYISESDLQKEYGDESLSFLNIKVPGTTRLNLDNGIFRDPKSTKLITDYYEFQHELVAKTIIHFAKLIKKESNNRLLCGAFYCYYFSLFGRGAIAGHLAEQLILSSNEIDFLCAPQAYGKINRISGGPCISRGLIDSARLHGKLWLDEMDQPTHIGCDIGGMIVLGKEESLYNNRKHVLESFLRGGGLWYYDFGPHGESSWWNEDYYKKDNEKLRSLTSRMCETEYNNYSDVLLVYDTKTMLFASPDDSRDPITDSMMNVFTIEAFKTGAAVETIYLSDIKNVDIEKYKLIIFVNSFYMDDDIYNYINEYVKPKAKNVCFFAYPGYLSSDGFSPERSMRLMNMEIKTAFRKMLPKIDYIESYKDENDKNLESLYVEKRSNNYVDNITFSITDKDITPLAYYDDGEIACAKKNNIYYFALPLTSSIQIQRLFKDCDAHIFRESNQATLVGGGVIEICAREKESGYITLPSNKKIPYQLDENEVGCYDILTGDKLL